MALIDRLRKAADDRDGWDVPGLLREAADALQVFEDADKDAAKAIRQRVLNLQTPARDGPMRIVPANRHCLLDASPSVSARSTQSAADGCLSAAFLKHGTAMVTKCAWCDLVLAETADGPPLVSHGICPACVAKHFPPAPLEEPQSVCTARIGDCVDHACPQHATGVSG